jgi:hypothetical protein
MRNAQATSAAIAAGNVAVVMSASSSVDSGKRTSYLISRGSGEPNY